MPSVAGQSHPRTEDNFVLIAQTYLILSPLLAQQAQALRGINHRFSEAGSTFSLSAVAIVVGIAAAIVAMLFFGSRWIKLSDQCQNDSPRLLFIELCRALALSRTERRIMARVAIVAEAPTPADVFIEPRYLNAVLADRSWSKYETVLLNLKQKLFA